MLMGPILFYFILFFYLHKEYIHIANNIQHSQNYIKPFELNKY